MTTSKMVPFLVILIALVGTGTSKTQMLTFGMGDATDTEYKFYDYSRMTIMVSMIKDFTDEFVDFVHSQGVEVQVVLGDLDVDPMRLWITRYRREAVQTWVQFCIDRRIDGINIDIEGKVYGDQAKRGMVYFVDELTQTLKMRLGQHAKVTYDVPYGPTTIACVTGRCLYWAQISEKLDYIVQMAYDNQLCPFTGSPTDSFNRVVRGWDTYIKMGVDPNKFIQAIPWYGPIYTCWNKPKTSADICYAPLWTKRQLGATQGDDDNLMGWIQRGLDQGYDIAFDDLVKTNKIIIEDGENIMQVFFDNATTYDMKLDRCVLKDVGAGVSMWWTKALGYSTEAKRERNRLYWDHLNGVYDKLVELRGD